MPADSTVPIICVGPGTGVVPFIGFLQERQRQDKVLGPCHLYFGCRDRDTDYIYREFLEKMENKKILTQLNTAFSRAADGSPKTYVQDFIKNDIELIRSLIIDQGAYFYICGATAMGSEVQTLLKEAVGEDTFKALKDQKRLCIELWTD